VGRLTLLELARAAGLSVSSKADRLVIKGPRSADALARDLIRRKAEVLQLLADVAPEQSLPAPAPLPWREDEPPGPGRWKCLNQFCRDGSRWWRSRWNVVNCENCVPPSFPELVAARGGRTNAPLVDPARSKQSIE
jgi:hypothetical protein